MGVRVGAVLAAGCFAGSEAGAFFAAGFFCGAFVAGAFFCGGDVGASFPALLREAVTSPGGPTAQALRVLEAHGLRAAFADAVEACRDRSQALGSAYGS